MSARGTASTVMLGAFWTASLLLGLMIALVMRDTSQNTLKAAEANERTAEKYAEIAKGLGITP